MEKSRDFSKGAMWKNILYMAIPYTASQIIQVLYNIVDRIYIGHMNTGDGLALTGVGLAFPVISIISAFTNLFSTGGAPLCSIERGKGNHEKAREILGNSFSLIVGTGLVLMLLFYFFMKPILYAFGASDLTYPYARAYLQIYLTGTLFAMIGFGMNPFINSQGFGKVGMMTTMVGAIANIILDPVFIFVFRMGIRGAAIATVISQGLSCFWVLRFLTGNKPMYKIDGKYMKVKNPGLVGEILTLGVSGFTMMVTNSLTQIACNTTLQRYGGELYVGSMTILNSIRDIFTLVVHGLTIGAQPVLGYNFGAGKYQRVKDGIKFVSIGGIAYTFLAWLVIDLFPDVFIRMFTKDEALIAVAIPALNIFFMGFFMMSFQFCGQSIFVSLGYSKHAIFFSLLRKVFIVVPLTLLLPVYIGVNGVFYAEPISNYIGGIACYTTMIFTVWKTLGKEERKSREMSTNRK